MSTPIPSGGETPVLDFYAIRRPSDAALCPVLTVSRLRGFFTRTLRQHYQSREHVRFLAEELECLVYGDNLSIEVGNTSAKGDAIKSNAIFINLAPVSLRPAGQDGGVIMNDDRSRAHRHYLATTQLVVTHVSDSLDLASNMAESTAAFLTAATEQFRQQRVFEKFSPAIIGAAQPHDRENRPSGFRVDCVFDLSYLYHVVTTLESHRLKRVTLMVEPV